MKEAHSSPINLPANEKHFIDPERLSVVLQLRLKHSLILRWKKRLSFSDSLSRNETSRQVLVLYLSFSTFHQEILWFLLHYIYLTVTFEIQFLYSTLFLTSVVLGLHHTLLCLHVSFLISFFPLALLSFSPLCLFISLRFSFLLSVLLTSSPSFFFPSIFLIFLFHLFPLFLFLCFSLFLRYFCFCSWSKSMKIPQNREFIQQP